MCKLQVFRRFEITPALSWANTEKGEIRRHELDFTEKLDG